MAINLTAIERTFMLENVTGATAQTPHNQLRKVFYLSQITVDPSHYTSVGSLEDLWLKQVIIDGGDTPSVGADNSTLWKEAVISIGETPSKYINENKARYYLNA